MYVRMGTDRSSQELSNLPVPLRAEAEPNAVPDAEDKPGKSRQPQSDQVDFSCSGKDPPAYGKERPDRVENEKKEISGVKHQFAAAMIRESERPDVCRLSVPPHRK